MKALTLTQPWATLVILGIKKWETRGWFPPPDSRTGRIAIHAAKGWTRDDRDFADWLNLTDVLSVPTVDLPLGAVLGTVRLDGLIRTNPELIRRHITPLEYTLGDYGPGRYAWELGDPQPFPEPIPARGMLGLWTWAPAAAGSGAE